jgi:hypothetical protein
MTFILVPNQGEELQINAWNWRPTLELLRAEGVLTEDEYERMGGQSLGGIVDGAKTLLIAEVIARKLRSMNPGERMLANLSVSKEPKELIECTPKMNVNDIDTNELYSTTYEWLETFESFCKTSNGFEVM